MKGSPENHIEKTGQDVIPEGTFEADLNDERKAGIRAAVSLGMEFQTRFPGMVEDFEDGLTLDAIVEKYELTAFAPSSVARNAVRYALNGYDSEVTDIDDSKYQGLMTREDYLAAAELHKEANLKKLSRLGGKVSGPRQFENKMNIHAQTHEEKVELGKLGAIAQGSRPYDRAELDLINELSGQPEFQRLSRINAMKIAKELNDRLHGGKEVRTPQQIKRMNYARKNRE
jgi:hypothetical protein